jgi:hypothetical protein
VAFRVGILSLSHVSPLSGLRASGVECLFGNTELYVLLANHHEREKILADMRLCTITGILAGRLDGELQRDICHC